MRDFTALDLTCVAAPPRRPVSEAHSQTAKSSSYMSIKVPSGTVVVTHLFVKNTN